MASYTSHAINTYAVIDQKGYRPYGNYSSYFKPAPAPACAPAPPSHRVPCPHSAAHVTVSAATFPQTFGSAFGDEFEDPKKDGVMRQAAIYALARAGYEALFQLVDQDDLKYMQQRKLDMQATREQGGITIGLHVRRGDRHPWEFQYKEDYIPLDNYMDEARQALIDRYENVDVVKGERHTYTANKHAKPTGFSTIMSEAKSHILPPAKQKASTQRSDIRGHQDQASIAASKFLLASDDPDIYDAPELSHTARAQDRIVLASKKALEQATSSQPKNKYVDEIHGWEGGFFRDQFWGLGQDSPASHAISKKPSAATMEMRRMVGRAYLLDLAVLGESDVVVCGISSMGCRLLAVMMGWEKGILDGGWRNIDGSFTWKGLV